MPLPIIPVGLEAEAQADRDYLDAQLASGGVQAAVLTTQGRYLQCRVQPAALPSEGGSGSTTASNAKPNDRSTGPDDHGVAYRQTSSRIQTAVYEYLASDGPGWGYVQEVRAGGKTWTRNDHRAGPETWRSHDWAALPETT